MLGHHEGDLGQAAGVVSAAAAVRARRHRAWKDSTPRIGVLFMIGSACFAIASLPGGSSVNAAAVGVTYFVGSIFFTTAALEQLRTCERSDRADLLSSLIQFAGTLFFNVNTFDGMLDQLSSGRQDLLVWAPDAVGSGCFLVASMLALVTVWREPLFAHARRIARFNLLGSIAFGASAVASYVLPDSGALLDATVARTMTLWGAVCFFGGAYLLTGLPRDHVRVAPQVP
jgi:YrhK-like protein